MRLRIDLAYDGTNFHGFARQRRSESAAEQTELRTVQGVLESALELVLREPVSLTVAGRTDAGVHATGQVVHLDVSPESLQQRSIDGNPTRLVRRLGKLLPLDVRVLRCQEVPAEFDARFSALRRHYRYRLTTAEHGALPTRRLDTAVWGRAVDLDRLQAAADYTLGLHDFAAFCRPREGATTVRELQRFTWYEVSTAEEPDTYEAILSADAFCWNMVRSLVGACLMIGQKRHEADLMGQLLRETKRSDRVPLAPAAGLTLIGVDYPDTGDLAARAELTRAKRHSSPPADQCSPDARHQLRDDETKIPH